ncbi:MAG: L-2-amino-thiazoline-4-carboxylic acid hydrolase [Thermincola sp.]|jgi:predicted ArsR family transcriptional regulator|nr:L-2-amino-thiazoline-4-carboxylic acid hydrolase [Thermincola sp.]MDT3704213.1 L-2-amino-thiazoline-4-carboxylic acid hydrolase [Thermincola sp.]
MSENVDKTSIRQEKEWRSMIVISHDIFHCWRQVVEEKLGPKEAVELVDRFWERVGEGTGKAYLNRGRDTGDLEQIVGAMVRVSQTMGEKARMIKEGNDYLLIHDACPWIDSFRDYGAADQCQAGCDRWFVKSTETISPQFTVMTESCLAAGDKNCTRRYSKKVQGEQKVWAKPMEIEEGL